MSDRESYEDHMAPSERPDYMASGFDTSTGEVAPTAGGALDELTLMIRQMAELERRKDILSEKLKEINKHLDQLRLSQIPEAMAALEVPTITVSEVGRVALTADVYASIPAENKEQAYEWLNENGYGNCIIETTNASTLKAIFRRRLREGQEIPEGIFKVTPYTRASITKV